MAQLIYPTVQVSNVNSQVEGGGSQLHSVEDGGKVNSGNGTVKTTTTTSNLLRTSSSDNVAGAGLDGILPLSLMLMITLLSKRRLWANVLATVCATFIFSESYIEIMDQTRRKQAPANATPNLNPWDQLNNWTRFELALRSETPPTIFYCNAHEFFNFIKDLLPEYKTESIDGKWHGKHLQRRQSTEYDLFIVNYGYGFQCKEPGGPTWLLQRFKGQYIWMTGESNKYPLTQPFDEEDPRHHVFGPSSWRPNDMPISYLQVAWWNTFKTVLSPAAMTDGSLRPNGGNKTNFLVYAQGNCVGYRDEAFGRLSALGKVHQAGKCGPPRGTDLTNVTKVIFGVSVYNWRNNFLGGHYAKYRFCLVMEHSNELELPFYVTEKILMAFASGCVPIYYGPKDTIHRIFNEKAFVYYDVMDPLPALSLVEQLEANQTYYEEMMAEPIVANGWSTVEEYFSFEAQVKKKLNLPG